MLPLFQKVLILKKCQLKYMVCWMQSDLHFCTNSLSLCESWQIFHESLLIFIFCYITIKYIHGLAAKPLGCYNWDEIPCILIPIRMGFPGNSVVNNLLANTGGARDVCWSPRLGKSPGGENDNLLQYSCLENSRAEEPGGLQSMR